MGEIALADGHIAQCLALIETSAYVHVEQVGEKNCSLKETLKLSISLLGTVFSIARS